MSSRKDQPDRPDRRRRGLAALAPLAAAATVVGVVATTAAFSSGTHVPGQATAGALASLRSVPRYYMRLLQHGHYKIDGRLVQGEEAVVRDTLTGATIATIHPPAPFKTFDGVTGATDDRTFVLSASIAPWGQPEYAATKFYRARFNPSTGAVTLKALPIPEVPRGDEPMGLALNPAGTELAISTYNIPKNLARVLVYSLSTGAVRAWQNHGDPIGRRVNDSLAISWSRRGTLALNFGGKVWLLNTASAGGNLLAHTRQVALDLDTGTNQYGEGLLTPDGTKIVVAVEHLFSQEFSAFDVFSAASGHLIRVVHKAGIAGISLNSLVWTSPAGGVLVGAVQAGSKVVLGVVSGSQAIPIPGATTEVAGFAF